MPPRPPPKSRVTSSSPAKRQKAASVDARSVKVLSESGKQMAKSQNDQRMYRLIEMGNGMRCLLISDPDIAANVKGGEREQDTRQGGKKGEESEEGEEDGEEDGEEAGEEGEEEGEDEDEEGEEGEAQDGAGDASKKASCALCLGIGSHSDPLKPHRVEGLAHFVEHMLFMGTEEYPDENSWSSFLSAHGGEDNGETDSETTCFYFDVSPSHLQV